MLGDDVGALVREGFRRIGFLRRIVPGREPEHLGLELRIDLARREREAIDAHHHLGDREGGDITADTRLRHHAGDRADHGAAFVEAGVVGREIGASHIAGRMLEIDLGQGLRDLGRGVHEAEGSREDERIALLSELAKHALRIGTFRDILDIVRLDLVAVEILRLLAGDVMGMGVAEIADGPDVKEADLQRISGKRSRAEVGERRACGSAGEKRAAIENDGHGSILFCEWPVQAPARKVLPRQRGASSRPREGRMAMTASATTVAR